MKESEKMLSVFIGFMDEEVGSLLPHLIEKADKENRPLYIFERSKVDSVLFERHFSTYPKPFRKLIVKGNDPEKFSEDDLTKSFYKTINEIFDTEKLRDKAKFRLYKDSKQKVFLTDKPGEKRHFIYSLLSFNHDETDDSKAGAIVVIRSPEMGLQPNLVRTYLRAIMRNLYHFRGYDEGVRIKSFGAGGAVGNKENPDKSDGPGSLHDISGSFYVGSEVDKESPDKQQFLAVIRFIGTLDFGQGEFDNSKKDNKSCFRQWEWKSKLTYEDHKAAEKKARETFTLICKQPKEF